MARGREVRRTEEETEYLRILHIRPIATGRRRRRGNQLVEVSLIFPPLFAILLALFDFSLALFLRATMQNAVREGVRYAVRYQTSGGLCQDDSIKTIVKNSAVGFLGNTAAGRGNLERLPARRPVPPCLA